MPDAWSSYLNPNPGEGAGPEASMKDDSQRQGDRQRENQGAGGSYGALRQPLVRQSIPRRGYHTGQAVTSENQELLPSSRVNWRYSSYSNNSQMLADTGASPRTSTSSQAPSSRPMLQTPSPESSTNHGRGASPLNPPSAPFFHDSSTPSSRTGSPGSNDNRVWHSASASNIPVLGASTSSKTITRNANYDTGGMSSLPSAASDASLSINYLPSKFSSGLLSAELREGNARRRRGGGVKGGKGMEVGDLRIPKMGGGRDAFRAEESRMAGDRDEDEDEEFRPPVNRGPSRWALWKSSSNDKVPITQVPKKTMRWNRFKWILFVCNSLLSTYSAISLVVCLLVWFDAWTNADIVRVGNTTELVFSTVAATVGLFTSLIGWAGLLMNNRMFLAIYTFLCWVTFAVLVVPGYLTYKKRTFNLEGKINAQWSRALGADGRLRIQDHLSCCGYFSPFVEATVSQTCYARTLLPGCKKDYLDFEDTILKKWYTAVFSLVPVHIIVMTAGLLCSNHVTYRFGKGMMPKAYRLSLTSMALIMDQYAQQLAEQYGPEIASDIISRSKSQTQLLDVVPRLRYIDDSISSAGTSVTKISLPPF